MLVLGCINNLISLNSCQYPFLFSFLDSPSSTLCNCSNNNNNKSNKSSNNNNNNNKNKNKNKKQKKHHRQPERFYVLGGVDVPRFVGGDVYEDRRGQPQRVSTEIRS